MLFSGEMEFVRGIIVGAGSSTSTPMLSCVLSGSPCITCAEALQHPRTSKNHRLNPSFLLQLRHPADGTLHNVLIDCGKTFRESALKIFSAAGVSDLSSVLITHNHADAAFGIDDLREFNRPDVPIDVYVDRNTEASMRLVYPYLFPRDAPGSVDDWRRNKTAFVATIKWEVFHPLEDFTMRIRARATAARSSVALDEDENPRIATWSVVPIAVPHGVNYYANAFLMPMHKRGEAPRLLLYVSDISKLEENFFVDLIRAKELLSASASTTIEVLLLDMMSRKPYISHLHTEASIDAARKIQAEKTFFIGMSHVLNYESLTHELHELGLGDRMAVGYDGCVVSVGNKSDMELWNL